MIIALSCAATTKPKDVTSDDIGHAHRWTARMLESSRKATAYAPVNRRRFSSGIRRLKSKPSSSSFAVYLLDPHRRTWNIVRNLQLISSSSSSDINIVLFNYLLFLNHAGTSFSKLQTIILFLIVAAITSLKVGSTSYPPPSSSSSTV